MSPAPHPRMHGLTHVKGGPDPIPGLLPATGGGTWVELVADPDLTAWWRLGDTFTFGSVVTDAAIDSADFDSDSPRNLNYQEASLPGRATLDTPNPSIGVDDDGAVTLTDTTLGAGFYKNVGALSSWDTTLFGTTADQARTVICWIKTPASLATSSGYNNPIVGRWGLDAGAVQVGWVMEIDRTNNQLRWRLKTNAAEVILTGPIVTTSTWYFLAGTYDGATYTLYVDGGVADSEVSALIPANPDTPRFGISYGLYKVGVSSADRYFYGTVDEVALYKRALTAGEIAALAAGGAPEDETGWVATIQDDGSIDWSAPTLLVNY